MTEPKLSQEELSRPDELTIREIILRHIRKMSDISCQELTPSFWEERPVKIGSGISIVKKYNPDLRSAFINADVFLLSLVKPYMERDKGDSFKKEVENFDKKLEKEWKDYKDKSQDDWIERKLELHLLFFSEVMLYLHRIKLFSSTEFKE